MNIAAQTEESGHFFWKHVGGDVYRKLSEDERDAILRAARHGKDDQVNSDIRLSFGRYFLVVLFGRERRSRERLNEERAKRPVFTARNLPVLFVLWGSVVYALYSLMVFGLDLFARTNFG
jgi:hypothetical protein